MKSLLYFGGAIFSWILSMAFIERIAWLGLTFGGLGVLIFLAGLVINHAEHTRRR